MFGLNDILTHSLAYAIGEDEGRAKARKEDNNPWHTGKPTENTYEDGKATLYLVTDKTGNYYDVARWNGWNGGHWSVGWFKVFAWQKITPYKESEE